MAHQGQVACVSSWAVILEDFVIWKHYMCPWRYHLPSQWFCASKFSLQLSMILNVHFPQALHLPLGRFKWCHHKGQELSETKFREIFGALHSIRNLPLQHKAAHDGSCCWPTRVRFVPNVSFEKFGRTFIIMLWWTGPAPNGPVQLVPPHGFGTEWDSMIYEWRCFCNKVRLWDQTNGFEWCELTTAHS